MLMERSGTSSSLKGWGIINTMAQDSEFCLRTPKKAPLRDMTSPGG